MFLFGARQVGKSTLLESRFPDAVYFDLLKPELRQRLQKAPSLFAEMLERYPAETLVIVDEIQKVPSLLDEIHSLMVKKGLYFILSGSSARKLKRSGSNTLGGRAIPEVLYPLVSAEIPDFNLDKALQNGMIPRHYMTQDASKRLKAYVEVYLQEEIREEAMLRGASSFSRFMEVAAISDCEIINYENIASDCGVAANTVKSYFQILYDTLIGYEVPAFRRSVKRKLFHAPKFYYFDVGIANYLMGRNHIQPGTPEYGHAFEHFIIQELIAYIGYSGSKDKLSYWRTYSGLEVDAVLGDAKVAIEIKSTGEIQRRHLSGLNRFLEEYPNARAIIVSLDKLSRKSGNIEVFHVFDFLKMLWNGEII
ncbi:MAG: AAA family ATPase [Bacteroides sp.]|nr:AAA family ATPase [Bacteroides sp.]MCM1531158.1 AAA family ATPase [Ruminococcus flavefaciens]MCM1555099.1 AAA family ATPase [Bacteroides sp.]